MKRRLTSPLKNQKGLLILDFIFAAVLFSIFATIIFRFSITFAVVEVFQYVAFASARAYTLADQSEEVQEQEGRTKFEQLANDGRLLPLIRNGWYQIGDPEIGDFNDVVANDNDKEQDAANFNGVRIPFTASILYYRLPFLGDTGDGPDSFFAYIQAFTGREPTLTECQAYSGQRINPIANLYGLTNAGAYVSQNDNGC